jgi:hypothetical protein
MDDDDQQDGNSPEPEDIRAKGPILRRSAGFIAGRKESLRGLARLDGRSRHQFVPAFHRHMMAQIDEISESEGPITDGCVSRCAIEGTMCAEPRRAHVMVGPTPEEDQRAGLPGDAPSATSGPRSTDGVSGTFRSWAHRRNTGLTVAAAAVAPILYLLFIDRYATNSFFGDDWSTAVLVHAALHGHLSLSQLWTQYNETRLFVGNSIDVLFGLVDHFDIRAVLFFSAVVLIASYAVLLVTVRRYLGGRLTPVPTLVIGGIWFSLADVQNALWAFQVSWYVTVFLFTVMLYALLVPEDRRLLWFSLALLAAFGASLTTVQGFLLWPLGAICLLWDRSDPQRGGSGSPHRHRDRIEMAAWITGMLIAIALYLPGYKFNDDACIPASGCTFTAGFHHPIKTIRYFFALIGNVIPGKFIDHPVMSATRFEVVGVLLFAVAALILVDSWSRRRSKELLPFPLLLIGYSLAFDVTIAMSRSGPGPQSAVINNRYVMPNLILLTGVFIYAWARISARGSTASHPWPRRGAWLAYMALAIFLVVQVVASTGFGLSSGQATRESRTTSARFFVNVDRVPHAVRGCNAYLLIYAQPGAVLSFAVRLRDATEDQLGEFRPASYSAYRALGPPALIPACATGPTRPSSSP